MSAPTLFAALAANLTTNSSAPAPGPAPEDTEDVVEQYSFNTGTPHLHGFHRLLVHQGRCNAIIVAFNDTASPALYARLCACTLVNYSRDV